MIQFRPDPLDLPRLRAPLGTLMTGEPQATMAELGRLVVRVRPTRMTAVGDIVSRETLTGGIPVNLRILDRRSMRRPISTMKLPANKIYHVRNPSGVVTLEAWEAIKKAMKDLSALILVDGEEDLLALPSIVESPDGAMVVYGQPSEGIVVVLTTPQVKRDMSVIMARMTKETNESST